VNNNGEAPVTEDRVLRLPEVLKITGLSMSTLRLRERAGLFPKRFRLGLGGNATAVGWSANAVQGWVRQLASSASNDPLDS